MSKKSCGMSTWEDNLSTDHKVAGPVYLDSESSTNGCANGGHWGIVASRPLEERQEQELLRYLRGEGELPQGFPLKGVLCLAGPRGALEFSLLRQDVVHQTTSIHDLLLFPVSLERFVACHMSARKRIL